MAWIDRIREAAYTSPGGTRVTFKYEDVSQISNKKTSAFEFPDADGTYIQDLGRSGRKYPVRAILTGPDYDLAANVFEAALLERGTGKLEHPIYGTVDVVPFGAISRRDDLKTAGNQAIIQVTFWETTGLIYPTSQGDPASAVLSAIEDYNAASSEEFAIITDLDGAVEQSSLKNSYLTLLADAETNLQVVADTQDNVRRQFNAITDSVNNGIDILVSDPLSLAFQTALLIQAPARAITNIAARLEAYASLAGSIIGIGSPATPGNDATSSNLFHTKDLYVSGAVAGSVVSVVNNQFITKTDVLAAAEDVLSQLDAAVVWRDDNFESLSEIDTGASYQKLQQSVALAAGFLVDISFSLKQERRITLDRSRTIIDLAAELYGTVDSELDFLITSNNLSGSEILELPKGREIVFYI